MLIIHVYVYKMYFLVRTFNIIILWFSSDRATELVLFGIKDTIKLRRIIFVQLQPVV